MVQFKLRGAEARNTPLGLANQYWKFDCYHYWTASALKDQLERNGHGFTKTANKERLFYLATRMRQGLLSYENCTLAELKQFCVQRRLKVEKSKTRRGMIGILETEDENATFDRFLELPAELRNMVYAEHFWTFQPIVLLQPLPPPLTHVSHQLRQETLQLSIQSRTMYLKFGFQDPYIYLGQRFRLVLPEAPTIEPQNQTTSLFERAPLYLVSNLRDFYISGVIYHGRDWNHVMWRIRIAAGGTEVNITLIKSPIPRPESQGIGTIRARLEQRLKVATDPNRKGGKFSLCESDLELFTHLFQSQNEDLCENAFGA